MECFSYNAGCDIGIAASPAGLIEQLTKMIITIMIKINTFRRYLVICCIIHYNYYMFVCSTIASYLSINYETCKKS